MKNIIFFTGPVQIGKSTSIYNWSKSILSKKGIIQLGFENKRFLVDLDSGHKVELTCAKNLNSINIGNYSFSNSIFQWAKSILASIVDPYPEWVIIDEFGKLELMGKGQEPEISKIINRMKGNSASKLLLVVREGLLKKTINYLELKKEEYKIISSISSLN